MTDLTFCYQHMSDADIQTLETLDTTDYMDGQLSDEELEIPPHMVPPDPDDTDTLPSQVHPSYPYGNPTNMSHPAALPHIHGEPGRTLYEDMAYGGNGGVNAALRWKDLGLDMLLPVNEEKEEAEKAALARKMASGATQSNHAPQPVPEEHPNDEEDETDSADGGGGDDDDDEGEDEERDDEEDDENDENGVSQDSFQDVLDSSAMVGDSD